MLLILSIALLPFGLMALFASRDNAIRTRAQHDNEARVVAAASARQLDDLFARITMSLHRVADETAVRPDDRISCQGAVNELVHVRGSTVAYAVFGLGGRKLCETNGFADSSGSRMLPQGASQVRINPKEKLLRIAVASSAAGYVAVAELPPRLLSDFAHPSGMQESYGLALVQGDSRLNLAQAQTNSGDLITVFTPLMGGQLNALMQIQKSRITASEVLLVLLPILMWLAGSVIGWIVVDRLLLRPLAELQAAISAFRIEKGQLPLPRLTTPAKEIRDLNDSFMQVTSELADHDAEIAEALARQTRLTREVHHRVKNNLQVVSSLINLHARGAANEGAAHAYAAIQRRVDALAVVHRNHYAELEENRGVGLRPLVSELASNLRATAGDASRLAITLNLAPFSTTQDIALPVAFLITEIVDMVLECGDRVAISIALQPTPETGRALLSILAPMLAEEACASGANFELFKRVIGGLARQLRSPLQFDPATGRYEIEIPVVAEDHRAD
jgi:two-component sensor histidine kinase